MDLDLRKVRYFVAVADLLHFGRAAETLHIAQPVLSRQIRSLEGDIGLELLARNRRSVALTAAGRQFLDDARGLLTTAEAARHRMYRAAGGESQLTVGFGWGMTVAAITAEFAARRPDVTVDVRQLAPGAEAEAVLRGAVDVAFVRAPVPRDGVDLTRLGSEDLVAVLPAGHRLAGACALTGADLEGEPLLRRTGEAPLVVRGEASLLRAAGGAGPVEEELEMVARGCGLALLPQSAAVFYTRPGVRYVPLLGLAPQEICLARAAVDRSGLTASFVRTAEAVGWTGAQGVGAAGATGGAGAAGAAGMAGAAGARTPAAA
ncbi:LysR substrate-binding domain-containing protein [Streptomyces sp. NPDC048111]|uniref:LysR substrate-binding domain-containing protein n=1 Tax=Streptomyces sp. NPDC048111 TaxID=3365500 RepID=UPI0037239706